jgi:hypothetical protein
MQMFLDDPEFQELLAKALAKIEAGKLPARTDSPIEHSYCADPTTKRYGTCAVCDEIVTGDELWHQVRDPEAVHPADLHQFCYAAWQHAAWTVNPSSSAMPFFHATITPYPVVPYHLTSPRLVAVGCSAVAALTAVKPSEAPSRSACYFACENPENAVHYLKTERFYKGEPAAPILVYSVDFPAGCSTGPMALIAAIEKRLRAGGSAAKMIPEYWKPTLKWQFLEVFGPEMRILAPTPLPNYISEAAALLRYQSDHAQAAKL